MGEAATRQDPSQLASQRTLTAAAIALLTAFSFFYFPGHTILQSDTQIYVPILERLWNPAVLSKDIMAVRPHVTFTIYDEVTLALRKLTGLGFEPILLGQEFVYRGLGIYGLWLIAAAFGLSPVLAVLAAATASLGAAIAGPAVLTVEYEPVPRGFALPFLLLAIGFVAHGRWLPASFAMGAAVLWHPPTAVLAWLLLFVQLVRRSRFHAVAILAGAPLILVVAASAQLPSDSLSLWSRLDPHLEEIQRLRSSYNWVSLWIDRFGVHHVVVFAVVAAALWRLRRIVPRDLWPYLAGLPVAGILSVPVSYLLLERAKWMFAPQLQPARYLLYGTLFAMLLCAIAAAVAGTMKRFWEAFAWFAVAIAPALQIGPGFTLPAARVLLLLWLPGVLAALTRSKYAAAIAIIALLPMLAVPKLGRVQNFPRLHSQELDALAKWAREKTSPDAVFQFVGFGRRLEPGVFRARALRAVYVDWKTGGQANFQPDLARIWWDRWNRFEKPQPMEAYRTVGVNYVIAVSPSAGYTPVYQNASYLVFKLDP